MQNSIPTSKIARGKVVGKAMLKIGATSTKGVVKRAFMSKDKKEASKSDTHAQIAKVIIDSLGELKGISVKIAQHIALGMPFLPQEYLDEIGKSFSNIPPINRALIRKIIKQELEAYPQEVFEKFEGNCFGSASLGQVHLAQHQGQKIAVKVQYPGIAHSVESDLGILKFGIKRFAGGKNIDHIMDEIEERLHEEVDYEHEAHNTRFFEQNLKHEKIVVPTVIEELSTQKVLSSSFLEGDSFEQFLARDPSQQERDDFAQTIFDSFFISLYELKTVHADPNPGNFIFMSENKLGMIDFGCVKRFDDTFLHSFSKLHNSLILNEDDMILVEQYHDLEMIDRASDEEMLAFYLNVIKPLDRIYIEIFQEDSYDFKENKGFSKRGFETIMQVQKTQIEAVHKINAEYIFLDRTLLGYYAMFEQMGAKIDTRFAKSLVAKYA
ncbi:Ubiquinone biosynthesis monooxygenase UbiB [hydrothermal vent metagenome]|uniref:Ubiquinone biosynthesis monooxygenase UbiB n=1 Tax=hydrothermal vent metagenome TaxID=652676 RepID=A0A1W1CAX4_9ZZZZ